MKEQMSSESNEQDIRSEEATRPAGNEAVNEVDGTETDAAGTEEQRGTEEDLRARIGELESEIADLKETSLRRMAEMDNMRKRMRKERLQQIEEAKADSIEHFLPVNDDLQRTLNAIDELELDDRARDVIDGVRLVANKLDEALRRYDVVRIDETGVPFNVDLHDALMRRPAEEGDVEPNTVLDVLESGYRMGNRTIRFAKVIVSE